jgi:hypothetical protein
MHLCVLNCFCVFYDKILKSKLKNFKEVLIFLNFTTFKKDSYTVINLV